MVRLADQEMETKFLNPTRKLLAYPKLIFVLLQRGLGVYTGKSAKVFGQ